MSFHVNCPVVASTLSRLNEPLPLALPRERVDLDGLEPHGVPAEVRGDARLAQRLRAERDVGACGERAGGAARGDVEVELRVGRHLQRRAGGGEIDGPVRRRDARPSASSAPRARPTRSPSPSPRPARGRWARPRCGHRASSSGPVARAMGNAPIAISPRVDLAALRSADGGRSSGRSNVQRAVHRPVDVAAAHRVAALGQRQVAHLHGHPRQVRLLQPRRDERPAPAEQVELLGREVRLRGGNVALDVDRDVADRVALARAALRRAPCPVTPMSSGQAIAVESRLARSLPSSVGSVPPPCWAWRHGEVEIDAAWGCARSYEAVARYLDVAVCAGTVPGACTS